MSVLKFTGSVFAAAVLAASFSSNASATSATLVVSNGAPVSIVSASGFSYAAIPGGGASTLNVNTEGFLFCANVYSDAPPVATITFAPGHTRWTLPSVIDVRNVGYSGGVLNVNQNGPESSLACQVRGPDGKVSSAFSGYGNFTFRDSFESDTVAQFENQVNWVPVPGFNWLAPDWKVVPNDACTWDMTTNLPQVTEDTVCAASAGVRPPAVGSQNDARYGDRSPTMWTKTTVNKFVYLARIDARFGLMQGAPNASFSPTTPPQHATSSSSVDIAVRDGFDSNYLSATGTYCLLRALPTVLDENVCSDSAVYSSHSFSGNLLERVTLSDGWEKSKSMFVAVVRSRVSIFNGGAPIAAIATITDPGVSLHEAGDEFIGDNVVFGFVEGEHFPWMPAGTP